MIKAEPVDEDLGDKVKKEVNIKEEFKVEVKKEL